MSNNMNTPPTIRWQLLSTVSAFALLASTYTADAAGSDADHPQIWIELGGQMENIDGQGEVFAPAFLANNLNSPVLTPVTPLQAQRPPKFSFGEEGSISFQPDSSDWVFSAALRIGRSSNFRHVDHQTNDAFHTLYKSDVAKYPSKPPISPENFADTQVHRKESHAVLDFLAGKDVGLGMFGRNASSILSLGVRFAQFTSKESLDIRARPDRTIKYAQPVPHITLLLPYFHTYHVTGNASRGFRGVGPSLSWTGSAPFAGNAQDGEITFDWGADAAILFGKQRSHIRHEEAGYYESPLAALRGRSYEYITVYQHSGHRSIEHSVTVPNVGGFAGISFKYSDAKLSLGYRADFFFGAMDTGIDAVKKSDLAFNGPFASISFGLGD